MDKLKRQERYIVVKLTDLADCSGDICPSNGMSEAEIALRNHLASWHVPTRHCVVVERDWPEYELVWRMIEDRVYRAALSPAEQPGRLVPDEWQTLALLAHELADMVIKGDAPEMAQRTARGLMAEFYRAPLASAQPQGGEA